MENIFQLGIESIIFLQQLKYLYFKIWTKIHTKVGQNLLKSDQLDTSCWAPWSLLNLALLEKWNLLLRTISVYKADKLQQECL